MVKILVVREDITECDVDIIVNAANTSLLGGGGVDGVIHRKAGTQLLRECEKLGGCKTGEAKITSGYNLNAKYIIHTPGPVYRDGRSCEEKLLENSYMNSLKLAEKYNCKSIAFPNISTGIYGFPKEKAANIAISVVRSFFKVERCIEKVVFVCFDKENFDIYNKILNM